MSWFGPNVDCGCCCPLVECSIDQGVLTYTVTGSTTAELVEVCGSTETVTPITNGTDTVTITDGCVYFIRASNENCEVESSCMNPACQCNGNIGFVIVEITDTTGLWGADGIYYATLIRYQNSLLCSWIIEDGLGAILSAEIFGTLFRIRLLHALGAFFWNPVFPYCQTPTTYTFTTPTGVFTFTIRS